MAKIACMVVLCMIVAAAQNAEAAITCGTVVSKLNPCLGYVEGKTGGKLPPSCCPAVKSLAAAATNTPDRQAACKCLKSIATSIKGINFSLAGGLPSKCGVNIGYPISTSVDCTKVH